MIKTDSLAPADTREQAYRLLAERAPVKVVVDTDLRPGHWYVVRGAMPHEAEQIQREMQMQMLAARISIAASAQRAEELPT